MPANDNALARGRLKTTGGMLGTKELDCDVTVTANEIRMVIGRRTEILPLAQVTGTTRQDYRMVPWGPPTTQLTLEKSTSNQFGPNLVHLRTDKRLRNEGLRVLDAIESAHHIARKPPNARKYEEGAPTLTPSGSDPEELLRKLATLHSEGVLSDQEFEAKKAEILRRL